MDLWQILEYAACCHSERIAAVDNGRSISYDQLLAKASRTAGVLEDLGIGRGDRISAVLDNCLDYLLLYFAAANLGAILNPINVRLHTSELTYILDDLEPRCLVADTGYGDLVINSLPERNTVEHIIWRGEGVKAPRKIAIHKFDEILTDGRTARSPSQVQSNHIAHVYYTSGTTGRPKGAMLSHANVYVHALAAAYEFGLSNVDCWGHFAPMFHLADAWSCFAITFSGGKHVFLRRFQPEAALSLIQEMGVTVTNLIPSMLNAIVHSPDGNEIDLSSMRLILSGGAPISPGLVRATIRRFGCEYVQTYGLTETSPYVTISRPTSKVKSLPVEDQLKYVSKTGRPFLPISLKVVNADGQPVANDGEEVGEIWAKGPTVFSGYWRQPEETEAKFCEGWFRTGDLASLDEYGYLNIVDRLDDMIITGGENVYSIEVENVLSAYNGVYEACVVGIPDDEWGEKVVAAILCKPEHTVSAEELVAHCKMYLAGYKIPKDIRFVDGVPRTGSGKVVKWKLRQLFDIQ
ncbi:MAG: long-chain-fatty-acid--CoA ligase [Candidatus Zixiibacteriota bacterium]|nr:MAG: long-chain-fatty-acid--CoA ligase [candidate division Zixibacteria bacterium]